MSDHQNIEELFRSKLGEAEITPSGGVWRAVQRKLRLKQFLRFDSGRFNIWYAGALLVAGAATFSLLDSTPSPAVESNQRDVPVTEEVRETNSDGIGREEIRRRSVTGDMDAAGNPSSGTTPKKSENQAEQKVRPAPVTEMIVIDQDRSEKPDSARERQHLVTLFTASSMEGCAPLRIEFRNLSLHSVSVSWSFGNGEISEEPDPVYTYEEAGTYAVAMKATGVEGESGLYYLVIRVFPAPVAGFEMSEGVKEMDGTTSLELMNYSTGGFSYDWNMLSANGAKQGSWSSSEFQPVVNSREIRENARLVRMVVQNDKGCTDTAFAELASMTGVRRMLTFPTAFSGNQTGPTGGYYNQNDRRIDVFHPHYSEEPAEYHLRVYSKMGEVIFETRDIHQGWDGYYMQQKSAGGVYLWVAEGIWSNGTSFNSKGDVTLLWSGR